MNSSDYLNWGPSPEIFTIPEFYLPFSVSIYGLVLAAIIYLFGWQQIKPEKSGEPMEEPWKGWALAAAAFIIGQLPFFFINSPSIDLSARFNPAGMASCSHQLSFLAMPSLHGCSSLPAAHRKIWTVC